MTLLYADDASGLANMPKVKPSAVKIGGRQRRFQGKVTLAAQATTDSIALVKVPAGYAFSHGVLTSGVSLGTAVIAIGTSPTHGSNGQYRAAAVFTAVDTPTLFGKAAAAGGDPLTGDTWVYLTIATADLPASGLLVVDLYFSGP